MDFLLSNYQPIKTAFPTFADAFYNLLPQTEQLDIAVGFITSDSLIELQKAIELNNVHKLNLIIGGTILICSPLLSIKRLYS